MKYLKRLIEEKIERKLRTSGAVVIEGPKYCGKTTTSKLFSKSSFELITKDNIELARSEPLSILKGETPRLIDEWQHVPDLWNCARSEVDKREEKFGQFIFTGSTTPVRKEDIYHSGAGRIVVLKMYPMSLYETGDSTGEVSLLEMFDNKEKKVFAINSDHRLQDIAFYICRGGWPASLVENRDDAIEITNNYCASLFNFENNKNEKFRNKKEEIFRIILRSYARNISTEARRKVLIDDVNKHDDRKLDADTFDEYVEALKDIYIIEDIESWNPNFRSKTSIITSPTRHFVDTSVAAYSLSMFPNDLMNDPKTFGLLFEDFAVKELRVYVNKIGGAIRHYRDVNGLECDAIIHLENGNYALVEIKLGGENLIKEGVSTLTSLKNKIILDKQKEPSFMMILTAVGNAYTTKEGIHIVPINVLKD